MPSGEHLLAFVLTATVIVLVPGPSVLFVVTRSLTLGRRAGLATVAGNAIGVYTQVVLIDVGVGALVARSIVVYDVVKLLGAAYLVYLGIGAVRGRRALGTALAADGPPVPSGRAGRQAFLVGLANPKALVFFTAVLPAFVDRGAGHVPVQILLLGATFCAIALVCDSLWALAAGSARDWLVREPRRLARIGGAGGLTLIGLGAGVALSGRRS